MEYPTDDDLIKTSQQSSIVRFQNETICITSRKKNCARFDFYERYPGIIYVSISREKCVCNKIECKDAPEYLDSIELPRTFRLSEELTTNMLKGIEIKSLKDKKDKIDKSKIRRLLDLSGNAKRNKWLFIIFSFIVSVVWEVLGCLILEENTSENSVPEIKQENTSDKISPEL